MQNLMPPVNTPDKLYHDGDPTQGIEGTIVMAEWLNDSQGATRDAQQEIINVLAGAGILPDETKQDQLLTAIKGIITNTVPAAPVTSVNKETGAVELDAEDVGALSVEYNLLEIKTAGADAQSAARQNLGINDNACPFIKGDLYITWGKTDPNERWPGTTWSYIGDGLTLRSAKADMSDLGEIIGADNVTLTTAQVPAHNHTIGGSTGSSSATTVTSSSFDYGTKTSSSAGAHTHTVPSKYDNDFAAGGYTVGGNSGGSANTVTTSSAGAHTHTTAIGAHTHTTTVPAHSHTLPAATGSVGSGGAVSVLQKSIMVAIWLRTA